MTDTHIPAPGDSQFSALLERQKAWFRESVKNSGWRERVKKLRAMRRYLNLHEDEFCAALKKDMRKHETESIMLELLPLTAELNCAIRNVDLWMRPAKQKNMLHLTGSKSWVRHEPKGVVLILSPWNYPLLLTLGPLVSAVAAGNCAILKPSEFAPASSAFLAKMIAQIFPENEVAVMEGDREVSAALLSLPFDHVFFTGSTLVGKMVMKAAAENLVPVTLELGGMNPAVVDETASLSDAAHKLIWGKFVNNGQSCVAPNYVLVHESKAQALIKLLKQKLETKYGDDEKARAASPDLSRMIDIRHFHRVKSMLDLALTEGASAITGGHCSAEDLYIAPAILKLKDERSCLLKEEIFGPLLPVLAYSCLDEALDIVNRRPSPLTVYVFSSRKQNMEEIMARTVSGTVVINETKLHFANPALPFGGAGKSGMGKGHGLYGFREFSHERAVLKQRRGLTTVRLFNPPYTNLKRSLMRLVRKIF